MTMKIINGYITDKDFLEVRLEPGDALANSANPGSWETRSPAVGGTGIVWSYVSGVVPVLTIPEQYFGTVCRVSPPGPARPATVQLKVTADISTDKGQTYAPYQGEAEIQFVEAGSFAQLAIVPTGEAGLAYKKIV